MDVESLTIFCINQLFNLSVIAKLKHWNYCGDNFLSLHDFYDELNDFCISSMDELAEILLSSSTYDSEIPGYVFSLDPDFGQDLRECYQSCNQCLQDLGNLSDNPISLAALDVNKNFQKFVYKLKRLK